MGEVAERFNAPVLKTGIVLKLSRVRIPPSPFRKFKLILYEVKLI